MRASIGQVDVDARAEADQAEAVAGAEMRALLDEADDAPRDQAGDLHDAEGARRRSRSPRRCVRCPRSPCRGRR